MIEKVGTHFLAAVMTKGIPTQGLLGHSHVTQSRMVMKMCETGGQRAKGSGSLSLENVNFKRPRGFRFSLLAFFGRNLPPFGSFCIRNP